MYVCMYMYVRPYIQSLLSLCRKPSQDLLTAPGYAPRAVSEETGSDLGSPVARENYVTPLPTHANLPPELQQGRVGYFSPTSAQQQFKSICVYSYSISAK